MSTQTPTTIATTAAAEFTRAELITLMCVANARAVDVRAAAGENYQQWQQWQQAAAGSTAARYQHQLYQDNLRYANELETLANKIDATLGAQA